MFPTRVGMTAASSTAKMSNPVDQHSGRNAHQYRVQHDAERVFDAEYGRVAPDIGGQHYGGGEHPNRYPSEQGPLPSCEAESSYGCQSNDNEVQGAALPMTVNYPEASTTLDSLSTGCAASAAHCVTISIIWCTSTRNQPGDRMADQRCPDPGETPLPSIAPPTE
jgi:hypothetical protein